VSPPEPERVADGVVRFPLRTPFAVGRVNSFLLLGDPLTLVDTGPNMSETVADLEAGMRAAGARLEDVKLVLLTHQHDDHHGLSQLIRDRSGCTVAGHPALVPFLRDHAESVDANDSYAADLMRIHGVPQDIIDALREVAGAYRRFGASVEVDRVLADGEVVEAGGRRLRAHYRPGHSPTDTVYVDEADGLTFSGDHVLARISANPVIHRPLEGSIDPRRREVSTLATYLDSLARTAELELGRVQGGHGGEVERTSELLHERIEHHHQRKERVFEELARGPRTGYEVAQALWGDVVLRQAFLTICEVVGAFDLLVAEGRARPSDDEVIVYEALGA
jgi:glyoxylase-like metal-dependent hydrolase (beta-lactamase superfamily II)